MSQPRTHSLIEAVANTAIGFAVSLAATVIVLPAFGQSPTFGESAGITACFTILSILRQYALRRFFNRCEWHELIYPGNRRWLDLTARRMDEERSGPL